MTETGWGEFMIGITINFHDVSGLDPIQLQHSLKLFPGQNIQPTTKRPVMSEVYDEFVFVNPTKEWFDMLHSGPTKKVDHHPLMPYCQSHDGEEANAKSDSLELEAHISVCFLCLLPLPVITPEFAKDEDMAIAKLQAANETIQLQLDQQRSVVEKCRTLMFRLQWDRVLTVARWSFSVRFQSETVSPRQRDRESHAKTVNLRLEATLQRFAELIRLFENTLSSSSLSHTGTLFDLSRALQHPPRDRSRKA